MRSSNGFGLPNPTKKLVHWINFLTNKYFEIMFFEIFRGTLYGIRSTAIKFKALKGAGGPRSIFTFLYFLIMENVSYPKLFSVRIILFLPQVIEF